jgi:hypothetical protein
VTCRCGSHGGPAIGRAPALDIPRIIACELVCLANFARGRYWSFDVTWTVDGRGRGTMCVANSKAPNLGPIG